MHWQAKFRGPDFAPLSFKLETVTHTRLKDSKGRLIPTVIASHLSEAAEEEIAKVERSQEDQLLALIAKPEMQRASLAELALKLGWFMRDGSAYKVLVDRKLKAFKKAKLIVDERGRRELTPKGQKALEGNTITKPPDGTI
jgi:hypothetical protein